MHQDIREAGTVTPSASGRLMVQLITAGRGSSGIYPPDVLEAAAGDRVFPAGTHMYADHPSQFEDQDRPERSIRDLVGVLTEDASWDSASQGLVAPAQVFGPMGQVVTEMRDAIGVSIRAGAEVEEGEYEGRPARIVARLVEGTSVDFVTRAGRGGRVLEVLESARAQLLRETTDVPVNPAGDSTPQESRGGPTMPQIEEARLRQLEEAAGRVQAVEADYATAVRERDDARNRLQLVEARTAARPVVTGVLAESDTLPAVVQARVTETVLQGIVGSLEEAVVRQRATDARTAAEAEVAAVLEAAGAGRPRGVGGTKPPRDNADRDDTEDVSEADLDRVAADIFGPRPTQRVIGA